ncbi:MAG: Lrp/AsnC family transcriptional regulator [Candidatus Thorarchaeota archaeon]
MTEKNSVKLDEKDITILSLLQEDSSRTIANIAEEVGLGISTTHNRKKALEEDGVIKGYHAELDGDKLGRSTVAFILTTVRYRVPGQPEVLSQRKFCDDIKQHHLVQEVHVISGEYDVLLKLRARDVEEVNDFVVDFLRQIPAVDRTLTMFVMEEFLSTLAIRGLAQSQTQLEVE